MSTVTPRFKVPRLKVDPQAERDACHAAARHICQRCTIRRSTRAHHVLLRKHGGSDHRTNLAALCETCHVEVHNAPADSYREGWLRRRYPKPGDWHFQGVDE